MVIKFQQQQQKSAFKREIIVEKWLINLNMRKKLKTKIALIIPFKEQQKSLKALNFFDLFFS